MQTFLPYISWTATAKVLDYKRLGCQRKEAYQLLNALHDPSYGWQDHPVLNFWRGYEDALIDYYSCICQEWVNRGYRQILLPWLEPTNLDYDLPAWLGDPEIHFSHRSKLYYKNPKYYAQWSGIEKVPYKWLLTNPM